MFRDDLFCQYGTLRLSETLRTRWEDLGEGGRGDGDLCFFCMFREHCNRKYMKIVSSHRESVFTVVHIAIGATRGWGNVLLKSNERRHWWVVCVVFQVFIWRAMVLCGRYMNPPSKKWPFFISSYQGKIMLPPIVHFYVGNEDTLYSYGTRYKFIDVFIQENYNTPLEHTLDNPPGQLWTESRLIACW